MFNISTSFKLAAAVDAVVMQSNNQLGFDWKHDVVVFSTLGFENFNFDTQQYGLGFEPSDDQVYSGLGFVPPSDQDKINYIFHSLRADDDETFTDNCIKLTVENWTLKEGLTVDGFQEWSKSKLGLQPTSSPYSDLLVSGSKPETLLADDWIEKLKQRFPNRSSIQQKEDFLKELHVYKRMIINKKHAEKNK